MDGSRLSLQLDDEVATAALASDIAAIARPGDVVALSGDLGAGKTSFARAFLRATFADPDLEVPSPTFTLVQTYEREGARPVAHFDLYRLGDTSELEEIGLSQAIEDGVVLIEWPDRAGEELPQTRLDVCLNIEGSGRRADLSFGEHWKDRLERAVALRKFLAAKGAPAESLMQVHGDASGRRYHRISHQGATRIVMDWPPPGPAAPGSYDARAGRAREVRAFVAIAEALRDRGLSTPAIHAAETNHGFLLMEDFGTETIAPDGLPGPDRYRAAMDAIAHLNSSPPTGALPAGDAEQWRLPVADRALLATELEQFTEHYVPYATGAPMSDDARESWAAAWEPLFGIVEASEQGWLLRDLQAPNLMWLPEREGFRRVGLLDFQDALFGPTAYDVASLAQDARVTITPDLEADLREHYVSRRLHTDASFDRAGFEAAYAILGAQRCLKVLGAFARLSTPENGMRYIAHMPRCRAYLARNFAHAVLSDLSLWYEQAIEQLPSPA